MTDTGQFVHLHCHSEFSLLDGANKLGPLVRRAADLGMPALALTDHGVMYGAADFYETCRAHGIKPILGVEAYVAPRKHTDKQPPLDTAAWHMVLLARDTVGYKNLLKLSSVAALQGYYYKPRIDRELLERFHEGLIATSACLKGEICSALLRDDRRAACAAAEYYRDLFGRDNFYIELQNHRLPDQERCNADLAQIARELRIPLICSNDVHYLTAGDAEAHDVLLCIGTGARVDDEERLRYATQEFYLKDAAQMRDLFQAHPAAIEHTLEIAERCNVEIEFGRCQLPAPEIPEDCNPHDFLVTLAHEGLARRYAQSPPPERLARLEYELEVIRKTGFAQYILIVRDFAQFAERNSILFGVRGSAAGSLTSYALGITQIDPVEYGLAFERFLNPERVQMPDVDMDFEDARRDEVIDYVTRKYSPDGTNPEQARVAQIITFGTLAARAVLKDAGRVLGMAPSAVDALSQMVPGVPVGISVDRAMEMNPDLRSAYRTDPAATRLIDMARRLEGLSRHASVHAAGVIIAHEPLVEFTPLTRSADGGCVTQYNAGVLERLGLLKMDFLGLINLSILGRAVDNVRDSSGQQIDLRAIPLDDRKTYDLLGSGECVGVFQLESAQMRRYIQELKPTSVRDVAAMVALYRPGPMAHIPRFIRCKHGQEEIAYVHPLLEPILQETYGVIVYQEQVMQIAQAVAGFSLGQADVLRHAMGKKNKAEMAQQRHAFLRGAKERGVPEKKAAEIFGLIEPFAGYAFNKAHAVCYAMIAYQTAYLKANHPLEYMCALMACFSDRSDKLASCMEECKRMGIRVLPPDVNGSGADFRAEQGCIRFGLAAVKNVGRGAVDAILSERSRAGSFSSLEDFCFRVIGDDTAVTRATVESLTLSGAFGSLPGHGTRRALMEALDSIYRRAARAQREKSQIVAEMSSDAVAPSASHPVSLPARAEYTPTRILAYERDLLGVYLSDHPLEAHLATLRARGAKLIADLARMEDKQEVLTGGIVGRVKPFTARRSGERMAFFTLEDKSGAISCTLFPSSFATHGKRLVKDAAVLVHGRISHRDRVRDDEEAPQIVELLVDTVQLLGAADPNNAASASSVHIWFNKASRDAMRLVRAQLEQHRRNGASQSLYLHLGDETGDVVIRTPLSVEFSESLRASIENLLGRQTIWVE